MSPAVQAGPPFLTDDPVPAPNGGYEMYLFSDGVRTRDGFEAALPGFEVNYGAGPNLQLAAEIEEADEQPKGASNRFHYGLLELGVKYRFVQEDEEGWRPQIAFYPSAALEKGSHQPITFLPLWAQKTIGEWEVFGGGGVHLNPGAEIRNTWFTGIAALRPVTDSLEIGGELFRETSETKGEKAAIGFNLAALYELNERWSIVSSAGRGLAQASQANEFSYYIGLELVIP